MVVMKTLMDLGGWGRAGDLERGAEGDGRHYDDRKGMQMTAEADLKMGDMINTDYGIVRVAAFRDEDDGPEVGFVVDGQMGWASIDYVTLVVRE